MPGVGTFASKPRVATSAANATVGTRAIMFAMSHQAVAGVAVNAERSAKIQRRERCPQGAGVYTYRWKRQPAMSNPNVCAMGIGGCWQHAVCMGER